MDVQIGFLIDFAKRLKEKSIGERQEILDDLWQLRDCMDTTDDETTPAMRHILLHLLRSSA